MVGDVATLNIDMRGGSYGKGKHRVRIRSEPYLRDYDIVFHKFDKPSVLKVIKIQFQGKISTVLVFDRLREFLLHQVEVYFSRVVPKYPLVMGFDSKDTKLYFRGEDLVVPDIDAIDMLKAKEFPQDQLNQNLHLENKKFNTKRFVAELATCYSNVEVRKEELGENFVKFSHRTSEPFCYVEIKLANECLALNYESFPVSSTDFRELNVYFHTSDTRRGFPLLVEVVLKSGFRQLLKLSSLDNGCSLTKMLRVHGLSREELLNCLRGTYWVLKEQLEKLFESSPCKGDCGGPPKNKPKEGFPVLSLLLIFSTFFATTFTVHVAYRLLVLRRRNII